LADLRCFLHTRLAGWDHLPVGQDDPEKRIAELERQLAEQKRMPQLERQQAEAVSVPKAGLRHRWRLARGMVKVTDPDGVLWKVYRRWFPNWDLSFLHGADPGDFGAYLLAVLWPPWFIAKCLGVRWIISIERNGNEMGDARVRGWRKSQRRIQEIAEAAAAGTLRKELAARK
jgi:hypothetical protein